MNKYEPSKIEQKWQKKWKDQGVYKVDLSEKDSREKYYLLVEFVYPSGDLHMGHWFAFCVPDILGRMKRMQGYKVFAPIGFDAFGLPAENAAIKRGIHPRDWTLGNIARMKEQFGTMGLICDWDYEVVTCDPGYFKWNQWIFLKMLEKGLAYRGKTLSNWCSVDQTVLANENVESGKCWRCGSEVVQKEVEQWFFKLTEYSERLLWDNPPQVAWPKSLVESQNNWIGKSEGIRIKFLISNLQSQISNRPNFVLLHGFGGSPHDVFFPWLKKSLEEKGYEVQAPLLPSSDIPAEDEQVNFVLKNIKTDQNTIFLGHSLGAVVAMKVVEKLKSPVAGLVLAAGFLEPKFKDNKRPFTDTFKWQFDFEKVRENTDMIKVLSAKNDYAVPAEQGKALAKNLSGELLEVKAQADHFTAEHEPVVLKTLLSFGMNDELSTTKCVEVFTTRADTIFGATFLVLSPEHPAVSLVTTKQQRKEVDEYVKKAAKKSELERKESREKTGVFTGSYVENPVNGEKIPVWVSDYVLWGYGTGSVMGVPGSDARDFEFAKKFKLPIVRVIASEVDDKSQVGSTEEVLVSGFLVNSGKFDGLAAGREAISKISEYLEKQGIAEREVNFHVHDWSMSRQRYWGTPIPVILCDSCGVVPVAEKDLPVELPYEVDFAPKGRPPLATAEEWVNVKCPKCGKAAKREVETMDTFVDSSWYFLRYVDPKNDKEIFDKKLVAAYTPLDIYFGGAEHTVGHTLYSRFFVKFFHDLGLVDFDEYALKRIHHGVILGPDGARMSKSKGNVVNPDEQVSEFGADAVRMYLAFLGPYDIVVSWNSSGIAGVYNFLNRAWRLQEAIGEAKVSHEDEMIMHRTIKKVGEDVGNIKFNTAIAALMEWLNKLSKKAHTGKVSKVEYETFLRLLAPFAPHMSEELWELIGNRFSIHNEQWPKFDEKKIISEMVTVVVQINGKVRDSLLVEAGSDQKKVEKLALESDRVQKFVGKNAPQKVIYIPDKLVNFVI